MPQDKQFKKYNFNIKLTYFKVLKHFASFLLYMFMIIYIHTITTTYLKLELSTKHVILSYYCITMINSKVQ